MATKSGPQQGPRKPLNLNASVVASSAKQQNRPGTNSPNPKAPKSVNTNDVNKPVNKAAQQQQKNGAGNGTPTKTEKAAETQKTQNGVDKPNGNPKEKQQQNGNQTAKQDAPEKVAEKTKAPQKASEQQEVSVDSKKGNEQQSGPTRRSEVEESKKKAEDIKKKEEESKKKADEAKKIDETKKKAEEAKKEAEAKKKAEDVKKKDEEAKKEEQTKKKAAEIKQSADEAKNKTQVEEPLQVALPAKVTSSPSTRRAVAEQKKSTPTKKYISPHNVIPAEIVLEEHMEIDIGEPLAQEDMDAIVAEAKAHAALQKPSATSTPGKAIERKHDSRTVDAEMRALDRKNCPPSYSAISGRRSIRALNDHTPSHFRESYRRINTELDYSLASNSSMNVTVGSEVPNNSSFSFFGRGRKRERENANVEQTAGDGVLSPPKRKRLDLYGLLKSCPSPVQLFRGFSKITLESRNSNSLRLASEDVEPELENVSDVIDDDNTAEATAAIEPAEAPVAVVEDPIKADKSCDSPVEDVANDDEIFSDAEPQTVSAGGDPVAPKKGCSIM